MSNGTDFGHKDGVDLKDLFIAHLENVKLLIAANDKNYNQRFDNSTIAVNAALAAADRATTKAELASDKRFEGVNEFRSTLADQQRTLMPRLEYEVQHKALENKVDAMQITLNEKIDGLNLTTISRQGQQLGQKEGMGIVALIAGVVSTLIVIISRFVK